MSGIKWIWFFTVFFTVTGCVTVTIPEAYNFRVKELQSNPYGCWMEVILQKPLSQEETDIVSGELLNLSSDSAFLLVSDGIVRSIEKSVIDSARLYTHKNQSGTYIGITGILVIPSVLGALINTEYAGGFLTLAIPSTLVGGVHAIIEASKKNNILLFPQKNSLDDLALFARYPAGMPENIDRSKLRLKKL